MVLYSTSINNNKFSGLLELIGSSNDALKLNASKSIKVIVVVHKTSSHHFAVVYPHWGVDSSRKPLFSINLNATKVERSPYNPDREFSVIPLHEGFTFLFRVVDKSIKESQSTDVWIEKLSNNSDKSYIKLKPPLIKSKSFDFNLTVLNEDNEDDV